MSKVDLEQLMQKLQNAFRPERAEGMQGTFQCHIPGEEDSDWIMTVKDQQCRITRGIAPQPRATLTIDGEDLSDLLTGKLDPLRAFLSGKVQLSGDSQAVIKLLSMFTLDPKAFA